MEINKNNLNFKGDIKTIKMDEFDFDDEKSFKEILIPKAIKEFSSVAQMQVPSYGLFRKIFIEFPIPKSFNNARIYIENDGKSNSKERYLLIGVHHQNSDRLVSNFLLKGTKEEILDYLNDEKNMEKIIDSCYKLSSEVDDFYN